MSFALQVARMKAQLRAVGGTEHPVCACGQQIPGELWDAHQAGCRAVTEAGFDALKED